MNEERRKKLSVLPNAPSRIAGHGPISIIDIGSNSVRLVVYERLSRSPTPLFNEKALCALGSGLLETGRLGDDAIENALAAIHRFKSISDQLASVDIYVIATAAAREADNGPEFMALVEEITHVEPVILSGEEEAWYSAQGVLSGICEPDGVVGDMGGGSLELADVSSDKIGKMATFPLGGLRIQESSKDNPAKAFKTAVNTLRDSPIPKKGKGRTFYAVGGTWRSLALLHMRQKGYPLSVLHHYEIPAKECAKLRAKVRDADIDTLDEIESVSKNRRPLIAYGAAVLAAVIEVMAPEKVVISALGVREGILYTLLDDIEKAEDGLIAGAEELSLLRSRSPANASEIIDWTKALFDALEIRESSHEIRLREAACLLSDIGWRAHPDYRGAQALNTIAHAAFVGIDHPGRAFIALSAYFRHEGQMDEKTLPSLQGLLDETALKRTRILGLAFRLSHLLCAAMPGLLQNNTIHRSQDGKLVLTIDEAQADYVGERLLRRFGQIGKLADVETEVRLSE